MALNQTDLADVDQSTRDLFIVLQAEVDAKSVSNSLVLFKAQAGFYAALNDKTLAKNESDLIVMFNSLQTFVTSF